MGFITLRMLESLCQIFKWMGWWITLQHMILRKKFWNKSFQFLEFSILFISMRLVLGTNAMLWNIPISHHTYKIRNLDGWLAKYAENIARGAFLENFPPITTSWTTFVHICCCRLGGWMVGPFLPAQNIYLTIFPNDSTTSECWHFLFKINGTRCFLVNDNINFS